MLPPTGHMSLYFITNQICWNKTTFSTSKLVNRCIVSSWKPATYLLWVLCPSYFSSHSLSYSRKAVHGTHYLPLVFKRTWQWSFTYHGPRIWESADDTWQRLSPIVFRKYCRVNLISQYTEKEGIAFCFSFFAVLEPLLTYYAVHLFGPFVFNCMIMHWKEKSQTHCATLLCLLIKSCITLFYVFSVAALRFSCRFRARK